MENKLKAEFERLPLPETSFAALEEKAARPKRIVVKRRMAMLIAAVLVLLLCGAGWAKAHSYGMWILGTSRAYQDLEQDAENHGIALPETLDGTPYLKHSGWGLVPEGASWSEALLNPSYKVQYVEYGWYRTEETYEPGISYGTTSWYETDLRLSFGTTENELWRYHYEVDENGTWTICDVPESYVIIEYKGITIQVCDTVHYSEHEDKTIYTRKALWVDEEKQVVFCLSETDYEDSDRVVACAKQIIDMNAE